jgi:hypothetical protein
LQAILVQSESAVINRWQVNESFKVGATRFFNHSKLTPSMLIEEVCQKSSRAIGQHVLCISDSSSLNYQSHNGRLKVNDPDLGVIKDDKSTGIFFHSSLGINALDGLPLGYGFIKCWVHAFGREKKSPGQHKKLPIEEKESYRWLAGVKASEEVFSEARMLTAIHDRESDIYELFARVPNEKTHLLVRSSWDRLVESGEVLSSHIDHLAVQGGMLLPLEGTATRIRRTAKLAVKWAKIHLNKPKNKAKLLPNDPDSLPIYVVDIAEIDAPADEKPIHWRLLTTHCVEDLETAALIALWYSYRWWIEELFRILKSQGFAIEESQLSTGKALQMLLVLSLEAALKVLTLKQARYAEAQASAHICFEEAEIQCLEALQTTLEGKTTRQQNPHPNRSLKWAAWLIARLGGWNPHSQDINQRLFGVISLRRGLVAFYQRFEGWQLARNAPPQIPCPNPLNDT